MDSTRETRTNFDTFFLYIGMICDVVMEPSFDKHVDQNDIIYPNKIHRFVPFI